MNTNESAFKPDTAPRQPVARLLPAALQSQFQSALSRIGPLAVAVVWTAPAESAPGRVMVVCPDAGGASQAAASRLRLLIAEARAAGFRLLGQVITLTSFWRRLRAAERSILATLNDGHVLFDRGLMTELRALSDHARRLRANWRDRIVTSALVGSRVRGAISDASDLDILIVFDDAGLSPSECDETRAKIREHSDRLWLEAPARSRIRRRVSFAVYSLVELWAGIHECRPILMTMIRDGVALLDRGDFRSWQRLVTRGGIRPSPQAAMLYAFQARERIALGRQRLREAVGDQLYYAAVNVAQSLLLAWGEFAPIPRALPAETSRVLVNQLRLLRSDDVKLIQELVDRHKIQEMDADARASMDRAEQLTQECERMVQRCEDVLPRAIVYGMARYAASQAVPGGEWLPGKSSEWLSACRTRDWPEPKKAALARLLAIADAAHHHPSVGELLPEARMLIAQVGASQPAFEFPGKSG